MFAVAWILKVVIVLCVVCLARCALCAIFSQLKGIIHSCGQPDVTSTCALLNGSPKRERGIATRPAATWG
jgi:hypothetical protein